MTNLTAFAPWSSGPTNFAASRGAYKAAIDERQPGSLRITTDDYNREMTGRKGLPNAPWRSSTQGIEGTPDQPKRSGWTRRKATIPARVDRLPRHRTSALISELSGPLPAPAGRCGDRRPLKIVRSMGGPPMNGGDETANEQRSAPQLPPRPSLAAGDRGRAHSPG